MSLNTVCLVHHTHMGVGYTDLPDEVLDQHLGHLDVCRGNSDDVGQSIVL